MIELLALALMRAQVASTLGVIVVLLLRLPARKLLGPRLAYGLWTIVPTAAVASLFPSLSETLQIGATTAPLTLDLALKVVAAWLAGAALFAAFILRQEHAFRRLAQRGQAGPAVMGALWPRLVLPADFESRFTARERDLILLHERTHIRRGDPRANLVVAGCRVLSWFNPMIHIGAAFLRVDQELACDATVLALKGPHPRRLRQGAAEGVDGRDQLAPGLRLGDPSADPARRLPGPDRAQPPARNRRFPGPGAAGHRRLRRGLEPGAARFRRARLRAGCAVRLAR